MSETTIRPVGEADLASLHALNEAAVPGVSSVSASEFARLIEECALTHVAVRDGRPVGLAMIMVEGCDYDSLNYAWISQRYDRFAYVDRIAVDADVRGLGVGRRLYESVFEAFAGQRPALLCEVNLKPPNPGSLRFHRGLGFQDVGQRWLEDNSKGVVYLEKGL